jgi:hypothetical protein
LVDWGVVNHLHSKMIARTAVAVQGSDLSALKPFRTPPGDIDYQMAADLILDYLAKGKLVETSKCVRAESPNLLPEIMTPARLGSHLNIVASTSSTHLRTLMRSWLQSAGQITQRNQESLVTIITERLDNLLHHGLPEPAAPPPHPPKPAARLPLAPPPQVPRPSGGALQAAEPSAKPASPRRATTKAPGALPPPQTKSPPPPPRRVPGIRSTPQTRHSSKSDSSDAYDVDSDGPGPRDGAVATSRLPPPKPARVPDPRRKPTVRRGEGSSSDDGVPVGSQPRPAHSDQSGRSGPTQGRQNATDQRAPPAPPAAKGAKAIAPTKAIAPAKASRNSSESSDSEAENPRGRAKKGPELFLSMGKSDGSGTGAELAGSTRVGSRGKAAAPAPSKLVQGPAGLDSQSDSSNYDKASGK